MNELLTAYEAAEVLKVHINTLYRYLDSGKLKGHRLIGHHWRIRPEDIDRFVEESNGSIQRH